MKNFYLTLSQLHSRRAALRAVLALLAAFAFGPRPAPGAVTEAWVQSYSKMAGNSNDKAVKVVRDAAGDIIVTGSSDDGVTGFDMLTIKYSGANGSVLWQRRYNNPTGGPVNDDQARALAVDGHGNVVVTGSSYHYGSGNDWYTAKYAAADGALLWEKRYDGPASNNDEPQALAVDGSGNVVVMGSSYNGTNYGSYTIKYAAADGALLWGKDFNDPAANRASALAVDGSGDVVVTGSSYTARYAATDGALLWEKLSSASGISALAVDAAGNVVTGSAHAYDEDGNYFDYYMVKYAAADGARLWEKGVTDPEGSSDDFSAMAFDGSGNVVVARTATISSVNGQGDPRSDPEFHTAKYAEADGSLLWEKVYNGLAAFSDEHVKAMAMDGGGNVTVTGSSSYFQAGEGYHNDAYTAKYASVDGALLWEKRSNGPANSLILANAVAVDADGDVVVAGTSNINRSEFGNDFYTARYAAPNGALVWEKLYNGPAHSDEKAQAVAMDSGGNVIVTGTSVTIKYHPDGTVAWTTPIAGAVIVVDAAGNAVVTGPYTPGTTKIRADGTIAWANPYSMRAIAVDAGGNVIAAGDSGGYPIGNLLTFKFAAADGAVLWRKSYNGSANANDSASAVAVDAAGDVIVSGTSIGSGTGHDFYTAKYAGSNGALLWEQFFYGPGDGPDIATAMAVDASGNVVVTGFSRYAYSDQFFYYDSDYVTVKYAAANGALLWQRRYDSCDNGDDFANAVAVDAAGNVVVTGSSAQGEGDWFGAANTYTAKYAAADGALLWERREGVGASALALDGSGDAIVTGVSNRGFYTTKYAAADGAKLWGRRFERESASADSEMGNLDVLSPNPRGVGDSHSLALGPNGTIAIAGTSDGDSGPRAHFDYETILYREIPGPVSFAAWAAGFGLTGTDAAADADPDHDGIPNAAEYVLGGNPTSSAAPAPPTAAISGGNMLFTFSREDSSETEGVYPAVEFSTALVTWRAFHFIGSSTYTSTSGVTISENGDAPDTITVAVPVESGKAKFARLKVTISQ